MSTDELDREYHLKWVGAFMRWWHTSKRDWIGENLKTAVPLSSSNSIFLGAIVSGDIKPLSGKETSQARHKMHLIENRVRELRSKGVTRVDILETLKAEGKYPQHTKISAVNRILDKPTRDLLSQRFKIDSKFQDLYEEITYRET